MSLCRPCTSCVKRNMSDECQWDDVSKIIEAQPFASANEVDDLRARLEAVEDFIGRIPPDLLTAAAPALKVGLLEMQKSDKMRTDY